MKRAPVKIRDLIKAINAHLDASALLLSEAYHTNVHPKTIEDADKAKADLERILEKASKEAKDEGIRRSSTKTSKYSRQG